MINGLGQDLRYALRSMTKQKGFTVLVVLTIALGIGANTAIFSLVNAVLWRPLGYREPERLVAVWETVTRGERERWRVSAGNYFDWREQSDSFESIAMFGAASYNLTGGGDPEQVLGARVTPSYFDVLGVAPARGRAFLPEEAEPGRHRVVILGDELWRTRFGGDPQVLGRTIALDGEAWLVVGVMPPGIYPSWPMTSAEIQFQPAYQQVWTPLALNQDRRTNRRTHVFGVIGRLKPDVTMAQAQSQMNGIGVRLAAQYPENRDEGVLLTPLVGEAVGGVRRVLLVLFAAVGCVLLIACANVAGLLLARMMSRRREIAVRAALGASRIRLLRQFLTESLLLGLMGGAAAVWLAAIGLDLLRGIIPQHIPRLDEVGIDRAVLGFTVALSLGASLVFGLLPAWGASRADLNSALKEGGRSAGQTGGRHAMRRMLVAAQVALAVVLVASAGLLVRSLWQLQGVDPGFRAERVLVLDVELPSSKYGTWARVRDFYAKLIEGARALPGVESATLAYDHPLEATWINSFAIEGRPPSTDSPIGRFTPVSPGYFQTLGVELLRGRDFNEADDVGRSGAVIINEMLARRYFPNEDPIGRMLQIGVPSSIWGAELPTSFEIVGVARDVKSLGLTGATDATFYVPARQAPLQEMSLLVKSQGDPLALVPAIRALVGSLDADQPIAKATTMESLLDAQLAQPRFQMLLMGLFGVLALTLAGVGLYGLLAFLVAGRRGEIGVRLALGASGADIFRLVVRQGMAPALVGLGLGLGAALGVTRMLAGLLFGVSPHDPLTFAAITALLVTVAFAACLLPARRAMKVDPMVALRSE